MQHWYFLICILAAGLIVSAFVPALRLGAIGAAVLSKLAYIGFAQGADSTGWADSTWLEAAMVLFLIAAAVILAREAWLEARWDHVLPLRPEA